MDASEPIESPASSPEPARSWWQFSLRAFLIVVTLLIVALAWFYNGPEKERRAAAEIEAAGGLVFYEGEEYSFARDWLPRAYYQNVVEIGSPTTTAQPTKFFDAVLALSRLKRAIINDPAIPPTEIARLAELPSLEFLSLREVPINDACLAELKRLSRLRVLLITLESRVGDAGLAAIGEMTSLERLSITGDRISDAGLAHLSALPHLTELRIENAAITDEGLAHLSGLTKLTLLELAYTRVTGSGLAKLHSPLQRLSLEGSPIQDANLVYLAGFDSLTHLNVSYTPVGDAALDHVFALPKLSYFDFQGSKITLAGEAKWTMIRMRQLKEGGP